MFDNPLDFAINIFPTTVKSCVVHILKFSSILDVLFCRFIAIELLSTCKVTSSAEKLFSHIMAPYMPYFFLRHGPSQMIKLLSALSTKPAL